MRAVTEYKTKALDEGTGPSFARLVMPFDVKTAGELGLEKIPGQAESAPANSRPKRIAIITTIVATMLFGLYYLNYVQGWITAGTLNFATSGG